MSTETVGQWLAMVERRYPPADAAEWDNVGLQVGDPAWPVERVLVGLDVTSEVIVEAAGERHTLLLTHHPVLFRPLSRLTPASASGKLALEAAVRGVAVAAAHTNLDVSVDGAGTSQPVAELLDLNEVEVLAPQVRDSVYVKLVAFVPPEAVDAVVAALAAAGAGHIGAYDHCTFRAPGTGTFRPLEGTDPYSGTIGEVASEEELRVETVVPRGIIGRVVAALEEAHPYEEVAFDVHPRLEGGGKGFGLVGRLPRPMVLEELAERVREGLPARHLRFAGDRDRRVEVVACAGGAGDGLVGAAIAAGADVFVTGDLRHHVTLDALELGLAVIDAGHHATEVAAMPRWIERLRDQAAEEGLSAPVIASQVVTDPWR